MRSAPSAALVALLTLIVLGSTMAQTRAQDIQATQPNITSTIQRSGLVSRFEPPRPFLPYDPDRDVFFGTRYADRPKLPTDPVNAFTDGGLYGLPLGSPCVACVAKEFRGYAGASHVGHKCQPAHPFVRIFDNFLHPFRPVSYYYERGCYVPIYDLDPSAPGPGKFPYPWIYPGHGGG